MNHLSAADGARMPTTYRFLATLSVLAVLAYGTMYALAVLVEPRQREISVGVPLEKLQPKQ